jgi:hypothetical protein
MSNASIIASTASNPEFLFGLFVLKQGREEAGFKPKHNLLKLGRWVDKGDSDGADISPDYFATSLDHDGITNNRKSEMDLLANFERITGTDQQNTPSAKAN